VVLLLATLHLMSAPAGLRTLPDFERPGGWVVRWSGDASVSVDGRKVRADGRLRVPDDRAHTLRVGDRTLALPPRPSDPCAPLRFAALGDGRAWLDGVGPSAYYRPILDEAIAHAPAFIVNTGDLVKRGRDAAEWTRYLDVLPAWPPILAVRGNHDRGPHFTDLELAPDGPAWRWVVGGVEVVGLDTEWSTAEPLVEAMDALFVGPPERWRVVALHRPLWSRGNHGTDERGFNAALVPALERHGVHLVLTGHDHDYERFCSMRGHGADRRCVPPGEGVVQIVTGGAATFTVPFPGLAALSGRVDRATAGRDARQSAHFSAAHHYLIIDAEPARLRVTAYRSRAGNIRPPGPFDRVEVPREVPAACR
jgi:hypothetical protein